MVCVIRLHLPLGLLSLHAQAHTGCFCMLHSIYMYEISLFEYIYHSPTVDVARVNMTTTKGGLGPESFCALSLYNP